MNKSIAALGAAAFLLVSPPAVAAPNRTTAQAGSETSTEHENKAELQAFGKVQVPITQAIQAAEQHSHGKALDASFEDRNGKPAYRVKTYKSGSVWEGAVDANTGKVTGQGKTTPESKLDAEDKAELVAFKGAKVSLTDAVRTAEQKDGGKAIDAGLEARNGGVAYELELVKSGAISTATVDPQSGKLATRRSKGSGR